MSSTRPIEDVIAEITAKVPAAEWDKLPRDLSKNLDHYLYGCPKEPDEAAVDELAALIECYEADEPHGDAEDSGCYSRVTAADHRAALAEPHFGDCTSQPETCRRCVAEYAHHKARWILRGWSHGR